MKVTLLMSSGKELDFICDSAESKKSLDGKLTSITFHGLKGRSFTYLNLMHVDAVLYEEVNSEQIDKK